jgi:hypothetical protein
MNFDWTFSAEITIQILKLYGKVGLNLNRCQKKKYRPLGRWNPQLSMNNSVSILLLYLCV